MIHISKTKKGFQVSVVDDKNGKLIQRSDGLDSKAACIKNIKAMAEEFMVDFFVYQDNTVKKPKCYIISKLDDGKKWHKEIAVTKPVKPYLPK
jgi:hypothetical protein